MNPTHPEMPRNVKTIKIRALPAPYACTNKAVRESIGLTDAMPVAEIESDYGMISRKIGKVPKSLAQSLKAQKAEVIFLKPDDFKLLNTDPGAMVSVRIAESDLEFP